MSEVLNLSSIPIPLRWKTAPARWSVTDTGGVRIEAGPRTDLFIDPLGESEVLNAPRLLASGPRDFQLAARVAVDFHATYDAGALVLWNEEDRWAKLCLEYSPQGDPVVVSVVTRGVSDDCNAFVVGNDHIWLRVSRVGRAYAFHASADGEVWQLIRYFSLGDGAAALVGFEAQSPTGSGCAATFDPVHFVPRRLADLRDGT